MSLSVNAKTYTADKFTADSIGYAGPLKTLSVLDDLQLKRQSAKPTASFSGVSRTSAKLSRTVTLTNALTPTGVAILDVPVTIPVGTSPADVDALLNDMGAFLASATFKTHVKSQLIAY